MPVTPCQDDLELLRSTGTKIREMAGIMGLLLEDPVEHTKARQVKLLKKIDLDKETIEKLIEERNVARHEKD